MRVFGFSEKWPKLHLELPVEQRPPFSTFRLPRKDADGGLDWEVGETVQIVFKPRSHTEREILGVATIIGKSPSWLTMVTDKEARADGFNNRRDMVDWFIRTHGIHSSARCFNKLSFHWGEKP